MAQNNYKKQDNGEFTFYDALPDDLLREQVTHAARMKSRGSDNTRFESEFAAAYNRRFGEAQGRKRAVNNAREDVKAQIRVIESYPRDFWGAGAVEEVDKALDNARKSIQKQEFRLLDHFKDQFAGVVSARIESDVQAKAPRGEEIAQTDALPELDAVAESIGEDVAQAETPLVIRLVEPQCKIRTRLLKRILVQRYIKANREESDSEDFEAVPELVPDDELSCSQAKRAKIEAASVQFFAFPLRPPPPPPKRGPPEKTAVGPKTQKIKSNVAAQNHQRFVQRAWRRRSSQGPSQLFVSCPC